MGKSTDPGHFLLGYLEVLKTRTMAIGKKDRSSRRRQFELQCLDDIIQSIGRETAHDLNMQFYAQERLEYGVDPQPADHLPRCHGDAAEQSGLSETDVLSVPLSASLFGDYSFIYDEYID